MKKYKADQKYSQPYPHEKTYDEGPKKKDYGLEGFKGTPPKKPKYVWGHQTAPTYTHWDGGMKLYMDNKAKEMAIKQEEKLIGKAAYQIAEKHIADTPNPSTLYQQICKQLLESMNKTAAKQNKVLINTQFTVEHEKDKNSYIIKLDGDMIDKPYSEEEFQYLLDITYPPKKVEAVKPHGTQMKPMTGTSSGVQPSFTAKDFAVTKSTGGYIPLQSDTYQIGTAWTDFGDIPVLKGDIVFDISKSTYDLIKEAAIQPEPPKPPKPLSNAHIPNEEIPLWDELAWG